MNYSEEHSTELPFVMKAVLMFIVGVFVIIGLIGLILPIIPGILFLGLAAGLMTKVSSRFSFHLQQNASWIKFKRCWRSTSFLSFTQQVKLTFLVAARSVIDAIDSLVDFIARKK
ncbi:MAG: DUF454 family protein [Gammaproteobacteria bacterium]|nr:DUF454 family protein [Gammaproteobacteria bacterium]